MSRKFSFTVSYTVPVEELHRAITSDDMWQSRFDGAETATLDLSHPEGPGTIRVHMTERARQDKIPAIVRKVLKNDLVLERTDHWGPLDGDTAKGAFAGASTGITTEMEGTYVMRPTAEGSEIEVAGTVAVKVPLVGGAIEPLAEQLQQRVVSSERKFIQNWLAATTDA
ncbi:hypothetical protein BJY24_003337 [Nocardia transvalensis]|uniref:DUF2505 domain-containing protein n=1 Tax=Nocardia transvalensis TaxID=37333 RepID=A0A7W9PEL4_9NOCA|nr:DUF2505 domain-containing protein [Nocardia transvalensis]MBB5914470.1 hypothetical protein [Nocardia transvalensis]